MSNALQSGHRIAIAGATGRVGSALIDLLEGDPVAITALSRNPTTAKIREGVSVVGIDFDEPQNLRSALRGAERLFLSHATAPAQIKNEIALIDAAVASGVRQIVKLSALGPPTRLLPFAWHMKIEAHLADQPIASTVLRPSAFSDLLLRVGRQVASGAWAGAAGDGRINFIDTRDVAAVARIALLETFAEGSQRAYHLTGSERRTMPDIAAELATRLGHQVVYQDRPPEKQRTALIAAGMPTMIADLLVGLDQMFRESVYGEVTTTVEDMTGHKPRALSNWIAENIDAFRL